MFIYILSNPSFPGLLKIGYTSKHPSVRAKELFTTGVPKPFVVEFAIWHADAEDIEQAVHDQFDGDRAGKRREFFDAPLNDLITAVVHRVLTGNLLINDSPFKAAGFDKDLSIRMLNHLDADDLRSLYHRAS